MLQIRYNAMQLLPSVEKYLIKKRKLNRFHKYGKRSNYYKLSSKAITFQHEIYNCPRRLFTYVFQNLTFLFKENAIFCNPFEKCIWFCHLRLEKTSTVPEPPSVLSWEAVWNAFKELYHASMIVLKSSILQNDYLIKS